MINQRLKVTKGVHTTQDVVHSHSGHVLPSLALFGLVLEKPAPKSLGLSLDRRFQVTIFWGAQVTIVNRGSITSLTGIDPFLTSSCALSSSFDLADFWNFSDFSDLSALTFTTGSGQPGKICMPVCHLMSHCRYVWVHRLQIGSRFWSANQKQDDGPWWLYSGLHFHPNLKSLVFREQSW